MSGVVVTGLGFVTSIGRSQAEVLPNLRAMRHGIERYAPFAKRKAPVAVLGTVKGFDLESMDQEDWLFPDDVDISLSLLRHLSPNALYGLFSTHEAIADASLSAQEITHPSTGMYTASAGSSGLLYHNLARMQKLGAAKSNPRGVVSSVAGTLSFNLVSHFKIQGGSCGFVSACASSGHALGAAYDQIKLGRQKRMIVVGAEDGTADCILPFTGMRAVTFDQNPDVASRPFDVGHSGFVGTGGAVTLILEDEETALARGATIHARVAGWGEASDGYNQVLPQPEGRGLALAIERCLQYAGIDKQDVGYINAHAPSTPMGDAAECLAIKKVFGEGAGPAISSTKALTGHGLSLASAMECAFTVLSLRDGFLPGSAHIETLIDEAQGLRILRQTVQEQHDFALSNSSGFGGANVAVAFQRYLP